MRPTNLELNIEELVLHGFPPGDHHRIGEAVERELARLFAERGVSPSWDQSRNLAHLDGGTFEAKPALRAEAIGTRVARSVYGSLST